MREWITNTWAIAFLAMYMTLLGSYAINTHPDPGKRKMLQRFFSAGLMVFFAAIIWNTFGRRT